MDTLKRLKAMLLLGVTMTSLTGCSLDDVTDYYYSKEDYRVMRSYSDEGEEKEFLLVKASYTGNKSLKIIGSFNTFEEAEIYLERLIQDQKKEFEKNLIGVPIAVVLIGGALYYLFRREVKEQEKAKSLIKE